MASATATLTPSPAVVPAASPTAALTLANVLYEKKGAIAYVTVNRPKVLNALNTPTWKDLRTAFEDARDDAAVRGVILTGAGDKAFIAGADISELAHVAAFEAEQSSRFGQEVLDLIENLGKPVVAAINGFALGGGCETAMACTIRIAVEHREIRPARSHARTRPGRRRNATAAAAGRQGPRPAAHSVRRDDQRAGGLSHRARQRDRSGRRSDHARRSHPEEDRFSNAPIAVKFALEAANKGMETSQSEGLLLEASYFGLCAATEDKKEGTTAFLEKRAPQFRGR